jgi:hypothetical protein
MAKPSCTEEARVSTLPPPTFSNWVPPAIIETAERLYAQLATEQDPAKAEKVLSRLTSDLSMERVWDELYRKKGEGFFNPACLTNASNAAAHREKAGELRKKGGEENVRDAEFLEFEARLIEVLPDEQTDPEGSEQDRAAQLFLSSAYRAALDTEPQIVPDIQAKVSKLREVADELKKLATELQFVGIGVTEIYAQKLREVAADCNDDAAIMEPNRANAPWLITRKRGDMRRRTFVGKLSYATNFLFKKTLLNTIATVTNVVFSSNNTDLSGDLGGLSPITGDDVRQMLPDNAQGIRPSFGPVIMPMLDARMKERKAEWDNPHSVARHRNSE